MNSPGSDRIILLVTESEIGVDGRALRFAEAFKSAGFRVMGVGIEGKNYRKANYDNFERVALVSKKRKFVGERYGLAASFIPGAAVKSLSRFSYWLLPRRGRLLVAANNFLRAEAIKPQIIVAKHWSSGPIALRLARHTDAKLVYDAVEVGFAEHEQNMKWRWLVRRHIQDIERALFRKADKILTVGAGVAAAYQREYELTQPPIVIRNIPDEPTLPPHAIQDPIRIGYVGLAHTVRRLELAIESTKYWHDRRVLVLQLTGDPAYISSLKRLADKIGVADRVQFRPPVKQDSVAASLADLDLGISMVPPISRQLQYAEPNKLYQMLIAGIPVLGFENTRIAQIVNEYRCGGVIPYTDAESLAKSINAISAQKISDWHAGVRQFQSDNNWRTETKKLQDTINELM